MATVAAYSGFFIPMGNVIIQNMIFQNLTAKGGNGGDGISGGGGGMGAGGAIYAPQSFLNGSYPSITLMNVSDQQLLCYWWKWRKLFSNPSATGNEGGGGGGGFSGNGGSVMATGSTGGGGGGGFGGDGGDVTLSTDDPLGGGGGGGGGIGSRATTGTTNLGNGGSDQAAGDRWKWLWSRHYVYRWFRWRRITLEESMREAVVEEVYDDRRGLWRGRWRKLAGVQWSSAARLDTPGGSVVPSGGNGGDGGGGGGGGVVTAASYN